MNQYENPVETKLKYIEPQLLESPDTRELKEIINQLSRRIADLESRLTRTETELRSVRDVAKSAARRR